MIGALTGAAKTTAEAERLQALARRTAAMLAAARTFLTAIIAAGLLDILIPWPVFLRGLFVLVLLVVTARQGVRFRRWMEQEPLGEAQVARAVELRRPDMDNALIHAVQFGAELARNPAAPDAVLMRREISRAQRLIAQLAPGDVVDPTPLIRERKLLRIVVGSILVTALFFPRAYRFEIPRFALFWQDTPPFTLTDFDLSPVEARVRPGGDLTVTVRVGGLLPHTLQLVTESAGEGRQSIPLAAGENGVYTATLESLRRDTAYMAVADTGRSSRGHVRIDSAPHAASGKPAVPQDNTPLVTFLSPAQNVVAAPGMTVPLKVEAEAEIPLQRLELHRILNRGRDTAQVVPVPGNVRDFTRADRIDLKALGAKPGDIIAYYATAYDNAPDGIHSADSDRYQVQVVSDADYKRILKRQRDSSQNLASYRSVAQRLRELAQEQRRLAEEMAAAAKKAAALPPGDKAAQTRLRAKMDALRKRQRELQTQAQNLTRQTRELAHRSGQSAGASGLPRFGAGGSGDNSTPSPGSDANNGTGGSGGNATALGLAAPPAGSRPDKAGGPRGERANAQSGDTGERPDSDQKRALPTARDQDASRYPAEYRLLVRDYFRAVAGGK